MNKLILILACVAMCGCGEHLSMIDAAKMCNEQGGLSEVNYMGVHGYSVKCRYE